MGPSFSNRGHLAAVVVGTSALVLTGVTVVDAHVSHIPELLWILVLSQIFASIEIALLNLWVHWERGTPNQIEVARANPRESEQASPFLEPVRSVQLAKIEFLYLPESPFANGWTLAYRSQDALNRFATAIVNGENALSVMVTGERFAIEYRVPKSAQSANRLSVSLKYHDSTMFFLGFDLRTREGALLGDRWVKIEIGSGFLPAKLHPNIAAEYIISVKGEPQNDGWTLLDIVLPELIDQTWMKQGLHYEGVNRIRVRGSVEISPITLWS